MVMQKSCVGIRNHCAVFMTALLFIVGVAHNAYSDTPSPENTVQKTKSVKKEIPAGWERSFVTKGEVKLEVFLKGKGIPLLMYPSLGRSAHDFADIGNRVVAAGYRVIAINPRGIENSVGTMKDITLHDLGDDVWLVADHFDIKRAFILGQNFGNRVARTASAKQPDRVIGLVIMAAGGEAPPTEADKAEFLNVFDKSLSPERRQQAVAHAFFAEGNDASVWKDGWNSKTAHLQIKAAENTTDFDTLSLGGTAPGLIIQGLEDRIAPPKNAWDLAAKRPNTLLLAFPNMGHAMLPERPEALAIAVIEFINRQARIDKSQTDKH